ncbi:MAG: hypothetical protein ACRD3E_13915 [Terriglobales bacterium]
MKTVRAIVGFLVIIVGLYVVWNLVPPYFGHYKLEGWVADEATTDTYNNKTEDQIRETLLEKARDSNIPLTAQQIAVQRGGNSVTIEVNYTVHLDFPIHPVDLQFQASSKNKGF